MRAGRVVLKIAVTGARGFTGRHFVEAARLAGHETIPIRSDVTDRPGLAAEVQALRVDAVVHLAAISFVGHQDERALYDVNLFGTLNLLEALAKSGQPLRRILLASSANVYGNAERSPIDESQPLAPVNQYAMSKAAMEFMAKARFPGLPLIITRPFNYTGPGQEPQFLIPKLVDHFRRRAGRVALGNVHVQREYNDVRFVCDAYLRLLETSSPAPVYNVCTGVTYGLDAVIAMLEEITGHRIEVDVDPMLVRANEVHHLSGDPSRLRSKIGALPAYNLRETLEWMLATT